MNPKKHMIILYGEIKTSQIRSCKNNKRERKYEVEFNSGKKYSYNYQNVEWLKNPSVLSPCLYRISKAGVRFFNIEAIYVFKNYKSEYWHICFENGKERDYARMELTIEESCLDDSKAQNVFEYIKQISRLSMLKNEETGEKLLPKKFEKIDFIGNEVALAKYLNPTLLSKSKNSVDYIPIFPFGCNNSQYNAVKSAMENQISVIQGPPGTGKTQTILNIIANILIQGKTVQVVSNNNSATENVYEKLASPQYGLGFIVAALGRTENKKAFISQQNETYPDFDSWKLDKNVSEDDIRKKSQQLRAVFNKQEELAKLRQELAHLRTEIEYFNQYLEETNISVDYLPTKRKLSATNWMSLWQECQFIYEKKDKITLSFKIKSFFQYWITDFNFYRQDVLTIITTFQIRYYKAKMQELSNHIAEIEKYLLKFDEGLIKDMCNQSMMLLKRTLIKKYSGKATRRTFEEDDLWKKPYDVLQEYPVILSTTFSSRNSLNSNVVYDYLIMDEASQVDIATGALALSCAKNVIIVGDTKQLPNVVKGNDRKQAKAIFESFNISDGYQFTKSFLQSVLEVMPKVTQTLLREHYRCHPKIINFCNQKFYRGELIIMTEDNGEEEVLRAARTVKGNHVRNHYSQRQIDVIKNEIIPNYVTNMNETGIIAPYKNQVEALESEFPDSDVATVHKFQGREKDTIIISTVDDEITDFADDPYLINVAVSRAKKKLMLVVTGNEQSKERNITDLIEYIQYNNFEVTESKIYSVFDYLYKQYTEERKRYLQKYRKVSAYDSENLMFALLEDILAMDKFDCLNLACHFAMNQLIKDTSLLDEEERRYAKHPATHVDFLLYNRISKKPILAIEVDGYAFHKTGTKQASRDLLKNHILELYEIPLLRFKTNGSGEKETILKRLEELIYN